MKTKNTQLKGAIVLLITIAMVLSATAVSAKTPLSTSHSGLASQGTASPTNMREDFLHYDDGTNQNSIGLTAGGTFESAIRLTPTELANYANHVIDQVRVHYGYPDATPGPALSGQVKIYDQGTATTPGTLLYSQDFTGPDVFSWFNVSLTSPVTIAGDKDMWVSIAWLNTAAGQYPAGVDGGPYVPGKGDWVWDATDGWIEIGPVGLPYNWNLWARVGLGDTTPPETIIALDGTLVNGTYISNVQVTLTATDDLSGVASTMYQVDSGSLKAYTAPFFVMTDGAHTVSYYSVDVAGNIETTKNASFTILHAIQIELKGGLGVSAIIKNTGPTPVDLTWKITITNCIIWIGGAKASPGTVTVPAGGQIKAHDFVLGLGTGKITVTAGDFSKTTTGKLLLFFVSGVA